MAFKCVECNLTWPNKDNMDPDYTHDRGAINPGPRRGICPECFEEPEEDDHDPGHPWSGMMP